MTKGSGEYRVVLPSGATFNLATADQADHLEELAQGYLDEFAFQSIADLKMLDQVVIGQTLLWMWDQWIFDGVDDRGDTFDLRHVIDVAKKRSLEVRQLMDTLGIDQKSRKRHSGDGSLPDFIERIMTAAVLQDVHRDQQRDKAIELAMHLRTLVTTNGNSDAEEQRLTRTTPQDIVEWIREIFDPEMQALDDHFQVNVHSHPETGWAGKL